MPVIHNQPPGKPLIALSGIIRMVDLSGLTAHQKQRVWAGIKSLDPDLARLLKDDPGLSTLQKQFNGTLQMTVTDFNRYLQAGIQLEANKHD